MTAAVQLRPARIDDAELLLRLRNDHPSVRFSRSGRAVGAQEHRHWLEQALASGERTRIWIAELDGVSIGQVRVDVTEEDSRVSIAVDPTARGQGAATAMLEAVQRTSAGGSLTAEVHQENLASMRLFTASGFRIVESRENFVLLRWP
jgi:UDP-2,4-diacetamido-2,4,6-trideoxy-beta-L-altropyranose hydrolase